MNINGQNTLACLKRIPTEGAKDVKIYPLPHSEWHAFHILSLSPSHVWPLYHYLPATFLSASWKGVLPMSPPTRPLPPQKFTKATATPSII